MTSQDFEYSYISQFYDTFMVLFWHCRVWQPQFSFTCIIKRMTKYSTISFFLFCVICFWNNMRVNYSFQTWAMPYPIQARGKYKSVRGKRRKDQKKTPLKEKWKDEKRKWWKNAAQGFRLSSVLYIEIWWLLTIVSSLLPLSRCLYPWGGSRGPMALRSWELPWVIGPPPHPPTTLAWTERRV